MRIDDSQLRVGHRALPHFGGRPLRSARVIEGVVNAVGEAVPTTAPHGPPRPDRAATASRP